ncbi:50S ribosomal protein L11 methyltransferase [Haliscomenobacter hydrossis]|uniref:Ribosomal protein L11 methyltransferase n=1 Tax=Haliscomenobacter hydrossis (strain ATCC 27775 / DSM 1100 / LMG 10767 / O) TaxID=760192 RepID=F4KWZ6_HALH1|nr:50S ribosomal protein L11 methyltransferase [Haliscomenobacter hydrossis]AEE53596.1 ribosomal L11 methyltransferase [Haliscomenobacter hydrossis DSM 1100]
MNYLQYTFPATPDLQEILVALLGDLPFDTFEEGSENLMAFVPMPADVAALSAEVQEIVEPLGVGFSVQEIPYQNWNVIWESNFQPITVGDFCGVRADFHAPMEGVQHEIIINPKMAFGTGHHETTHMVMQLMADLDFRGKRVFDFGCGTGILAILAAKLGAVAIDAVDIEPPSFENTLENAKINGVSDVLHALLGDLSVVEGSGYDIILANINRGVILDAFPTLHQKLKQGGILLISGILKTDRELVLAEALQHGFSPVQSLEKGNWLAVRLH